MLLRRVTPISLKAIGDGEPEGTIEAIVSVFGNVDSMREVVMPGAFSNSLAEKLPKVCWGHEWVEIIGRTVEARELLPGDSLLPVEIRANGGLYVKVRLNLEVQRAREAYALMKEGDVTEWSIGYKVIRAHRVTEEGEEVDDTLGWGMFDRCSIRYLDELQLFEVSPVLAGANPATATIGVKSDQPLGTQLDEALAVFQEIYGEARALLERRQKEGRTFSAANMSKLEGFAGSLEEIAESIRGMLAQARGESSEPKPDDPPKVEYADDGLKELIRYEVLRAKLNGARVPVAITN